ncbi:uncharacterized protein A1O9_09216 [Exophiala aquamarina CBS 119918]|uniref:Uncharacterized protein n=1 Tax=Exophiala aquamarina CBS 119918 TaxID=1182545 RepID=A0A072P3X0_9EURO|nr:uncharacterized protein A1O9_09216 [Exophiala aquamarina CBS 119918]KEF54774.1 hypothetical protein A1O9_09216 [Exophiala aquamarina CBS 119918]
MAAAMKPTSVWIERGHDGRHFYVRKKSSQPSLRKLLTQALLPGGARSFFSRDSRQNNHVQCENPDIPLIMPRPSSTGPMPTQGPGQPSTNPSSTQSQQLPQPIAMYLVPPLQDAPRPAVIETPIPSHMKPQPQFLPYFHPTIFPMPACYPVPDQGLPFVTPQPFMGHHPPFAAAPPGPFPDTLQACDTNVRFAAGSDLPGIIENTPSLLDNCRERLSAEGAEKKIRKVKKKVVQRAIGRAIIGVGTRELRAGIHSLVDILETGAVHD